MRKTKLMVTHLEVISEKLDDFVSGRGPIRIGLRIAILQGAMDKAPIDQLSRRHNLSRQGIYDLVKWVNEKGSPGVEEEKRSGRPSSLTTEISDNLKEILLQPPTSQGYSQSRWDGPLVRTYIKEKHDIDIGRRQVNNWIHSIDFSLQRGCKKYNSSHHQGLQGIPTLRATTHTGHTCSSTWKPRGNRKKNVNWSYRKKLIYSTQLHINCHALTAQLMRYRLPFDARGLDEVGPLLHVRPQKLA